MLEILTPATLTDLTTLAAARAELGGATGVPDAEIAALIRQASAACARACNRQHFAREEYKQSAPLWGPFILANDLAPELVEVDANGAALDLADWTLDGPVLLNGGAPCTALAWWGRTLSLTYWAGYDLATALPPDLEAACLLTIRARFYSRGRDPSIRSLSSEGIGMTQYAVAPPGAAGVPADVLPMLAPWRRLPGF